MASTQEMQRRAKAARAKIEQLKSLNKVPGLVGIALTGLKTCFAVKVSPEAFDGIKRLPLEGAQSLIAGIDLFKMDERALAFATMRVIAEEFSPKAGEFYSLKLLFGAQAEGEAGVMQMNKISQREWEALQV